MKVLRIIGSLILDVGIGLLVFIIGCAIMGVVVAGIEMTPKEAWIAILLVILCGGAGRAVRS